MRGGAGIASSRDMQYAKVLDAVAHVETASNSRESCINGKMENGKNYMIINRGDEYKLTYIYDNELKTQESKCYVSFDTKEFPNSIFEVTRRAEPKVEIRKEGDNGCYGIWVNDKHLGNIWAIDGKAFIASKHTLDNKLKI